MPKVVCLSAVALKNFVNGKDKSTSEMLCVSENLYCKRRRGTDGRYNCFWVFRSQRYGFKWQFAPYDALTLSEARQKAGDILSDLVKGIDPKHEQKARIEAKKKTKEEETKQTITFSMVAGDWFKEQLKNNKWKNDPTGESHAETNLRLHILPVIGNKAISSITWREVLEVMKYENLYAEHKNVARKCGTIINQICSYAHALDLTEHETPATKVGSLKNCLSNIETKDSGHDPALDYSLVPEFFKQLQAVDSIGARALEFAILTASRQGQVIKSVRQGVVYGARWEDMDLDKAIWYVPATIVKTKKPFTCFLSSYAIRLLKSLPRFEGCPWVFTSNAIEPLSNGTLLQTIKRMNEQRRKQNKPLWVDPEYLDAYGNPRQITAHGTARSTFRTWATSDDHGNDKHFNKESAELCLAHKVGDEYGGAYNRPKLEKSRRELMEAWGRYCYEGKYHDEP